MPTFSEIFNYDKLLGASVVGESISRATWRLKTGTLFFKLDKLNLTHKSNFFLIFRFELLAAVSLKLCKNKDFVL